MEFFGTKRVATLIRFHVVNLRVISELGVVVIVETGRQEDTISVMYCDRIVVL